MNEIRLIEKTDSYSVNDFLNFRRNITIDGFETIRKLGKGSFAVVYEAKDRKGNRCALKILAHSPDVEEQDEINEVYKQEVTVYHKMRKWASPFIANCKGFKRFGNFHLIILELYPTDLLKRIRTCTNGLPIEKVQQYAKQILHGMVVYHSEKIIHTDIKPNNIFLSYKGVCKIGDFGSSDMGNLQVVRQLKCSRWYRPPEIDWSYRYSQLMDMWSFGCILYEMLTSRVLFRSESDPYHLGTICSIRGNLPSSMNSLLESCARIGYWRIGEQYTFFRKKSFVKSDLHLSMIYHTKAFDPTAQKVMRCAADLIDKTLAWNFEERISPEVALRHKFFQIKFS